MKTILRARRHAAVVVTTVAGAVAIAASVFAVANAVLRPDPAIRDPHDLVVIWSSIPARRQAIAELTLTQMGALRSSATLSGLAAFGSSHWPVVWESPREPERLAAMAVSASFFTTLGVRPALGRTLTEADDARGAPPVAILSYRLWERSFGRNPQVIGTSVRLDHRAVTIVGIMPAGFEFPRGTDVWLPLLPMLDDAFAKYGEETVTQSVGVLYGLGRRTRARSPTVIRQDLDRILAALDRSQPKQMAVVTSFADFTLGPLQPALWSLVAAAGVLLMVAWANIAALALTGLITARRDHAIRVALGARVPALITHVVGQSALVIGVGTAAGLAIVPAVLAALTHLAPADVPGLGSVHVTGLVMAFAGAVGTATVIVCGLVPAVLTKWSDLTAVLAAASHATAGSHSRRARRTLLSAQVALSLVAIVAGALIARSFANLSRVDLGFTPDRVLTFHVEPRGIRDTARWLDDLLSRLASTRGIDAAGAVFVRPLAYGAIGSDVAVVLRGQPTAAADRNPRLNFQIATVGYFAAMNIHAVAGRLFAPTDTADALPVVLVSRTTARTLWPGENPVGRQLALLSESPDGSAIWQTVVGVVDDVHYRGIGRITLDVYQPAAQSQQQPSFVVIRSSADPRSVAALALRIVHEMNATAVVSNVVPLASVVDRALAPWRLTTWTIAVLGVFSIGLTVLGLVAHLGLELRLRLPEFAIRAAIGASPRHLRRAIVIDAVRMTGVGLTAGAAGASVAAHGLRPLLFAVAETDPITWVGAAMALLLISGGTALMLGRKASTVNPATALRQ